MNSCRRQHNSENLGSSIIYILKVFVSYTEDEDFELSVIYNL